LLRSGPGDIKVNHSSKFTLETEDDMNGKSTLQEIRIPDGPYRSQSPAGSIGEASQMPEVWV